MPGDSIPSMWYFMTSWFTPPSLFLLLNLMIGTIALISRFTTPKNQPAGDNPPQLSLLNRVKSFEFSFYRSESSEPETLQSPYETLDRNPGPDPGNENHVMSSEPETLQIPYETLDRNPGPGNENHATISEPETLQSSYETLDRNPGPGNENHVSRTKSVPEPKPKAEKMKKSASVKMEVRHTEEEEIVERQRPATVRERKGGETGSFGDDEEVDAKADDFINKFKHQLKLQRIDSFIKFKEMLSRGSG